MFRSRNKKANVQIGRGRSVTQRARLSVETLEDRQLLSTVVGTPLHSPLISLNPQPLPPGEAPATQLTSLSAKGTVIDNLHIDPSLLGPQGFTPGVPDGLQIWVRNWDNYRSRWQGIYGEDGGHTDATFAVQQAIYNQQLAIWDNELHPPGDNFNDLPWSGSFDDIFRRLVDYTYRQNVTGGYGEVLKGQIRGQVMNTVHQIDIAGYNPVAHDIDVNLTPSGDYFAEFTPGPGFTLNIKYVTHGNNIAFSMTTPGPLPESSDPRFLLVFDTVTMITVQLPTRLDARGGNLRVSAQTSLANSQIVPLNATAAAAMDVDLVFFKGAHFEQALTTINNQMPRDISGQIQQSTGGLDGYLSAFARQGYTGVDSFTAATPAGDVVIQFTENPWEGVDVHIDGVQENFQGTPAQKALVSAGARVQVGKPAPDPSSVLNDGNYDTEVEGVFRSDRFVAIHIELWVKVSPGVVKGHAVHRADGWYAVFDDGTQTYLGQDWNPGMVPGGLIDKPIPPPPVATGLVRTLDLFVDFAGQRVFGKVNGAYSSWKAGDQIYIPGDSSIPSLWFTVTLSGPRNGPPTDVASDDSVYFALVNSNLRLPPGLGSLAMNSGRGASQVAGTGQGLLTVSPAVTQVASATSLTGSGPAPLLPVRGRDQAGASSVSRSGSIVSARDTVFADNDPLADRLLLPRP